MFFYLIQNSTLIEKELDNKSKFIKVLIYGSISYIILHGTLFLGGTQSFLYGLKLYFWMFVILDCATIYLLNKNDFNNIISKFVDSKNNKKIQKKKVRFSNKIENNNNINYNYESDSDSDSDINTDLDADLDSFKKSLDLN